MQVRWLNESKHKELAATYGVSEASWPHRTAHADVRQTYGNCPPEELDMMYSYLAIIVTIPPYRKRKILPPTTQSTEILKTLLNGAVDSNLREHTPAPSKDEQESAVVGGVMGDAAGATKTESGDNDQ